MSKLTKLGLSYQKVVEIIRSNNKEVIRDIACNNYNFNAYLKNKKGSSILENWISIAAREGQKDIIKTLVQTYKVDINDKNNRVLGQSIIDQQKNTDMLSYIISMGYDINSPDNNFYNTDASLLSWSIVNKDKNDNTCSNVLLENGFNIDMIDPQGYRVIDIALYEAMSENKNKMLYKLLNLGANPNVIHKLTHQTAFMNFNYLSKTHDDFKYMTQAFINAGADFKLSSGIGTNIFEIVEYYSKRVTDETNERISNNIQTLKIMLAQENKKTLCRAINTKNDNKNRYKPSKKMF